MNTEPLMLALSKIAPLEQWNVSWSKSGPRVCWRFFRPNPQKVDGLWHTISSFEGDRRWHLVEDCLEAGTGLVAVPAGFSLPASTVRGTKAEMSEAEATRDLAKLADEIEKQLGLHDAKPMSFSNALLTKEGLRQAPGPFEDFKDGGQRIVYLIVQPGASEVFEPTTADIQLHFEPMYDEMTAIFGDVVGTDLTLRDFGTLTVSEAAKIEREFPTLWKISDYYKDAYMSPGKAEALSRECAVLDEIVSSPRAVRGLDKLARIASWASTKHYGVLFSAP
jgi:hypothetical protein